MRTTLTAALLAIVIPSSASAGGPSVGLEYHSDYFWRGMSFYGDANAARGVVFPWASYGLGPAYFTVSGELASALFEGNGTTTERAWTGIDFIAGIGTTVANDAIGLKARAAYYYYPRSPHIDANGYRYDIVEFKGSIGFPEVPLSPEFEYSHYLRPDNRDGTQANLGDVYLKLAWHHVVPLHTNVTLTPGGWGGYFFYPSAEQWNSPDVGGSGDDYRALSDIVAYARVDLSHRSGFSTFSTFHVGVAPDTDTNGVWGEADLLHLWVSVGVAFKPPQKTDGSTSDGEVIQEP